MSRRSPALEETMAPVAGRIRRRGTFRALSRPDGRAQSGPLSVAFSQRAPEALERPGFPLVAYAVGRRHGGAVARNRLRRRLREAVRASAPDLGPGAYLVGVTPGAADMAFVELCRTVRSAAQSAAGGGQKGRGDR